MLIAYYYFITISIFRVFLAILVAALFLTLVYAFIAVIATCKQNFRDKYKNQTKSKVFWTTLIAIIIIGIVLLNTLGEFSSFFLHIIHWIKTPL